MKIEDLSISDLKSAYDFVVMDLKDLRKKAEEKNISAEKIPAYNEVLQVEDKLWHELLNRTHCLE